MFLQTGFYGISGASALRIQAMIMINDEFNINTMVCIITLANLWLVSQIDRQK